MTVLPGVVPLVIPQGADYSMEVTLPFDCTDKEVFAQIYDKRRTQKLLDLVIVWTNRAAGILSINIPWDDSRTLPGAGDKLVVVGLWDLLVVDSDTGKRDYYLEGAVSVNPRSTDADSFDPVAP